MATLELSKYYCDLLLQDFHCTRKVNLQSGTLRQYSNENMFITDGAV